MDEVSGATRSDSTAIVAGIDLSAPKPERSAAMWSMPFSSGTIAPTDSGYQWRTRRVQLCGFYGDPKNIRMQALPLHARLGRGGCQTSFPVKFRCDMFAAAPGRTIIVTGAPKCRKAVAPISPRRRPRQGLHA